MSLIRFRMLICWRFKFVVLVSVFCFRQKRILRRFKRAFQGWTNSCTKPQIKPLGHKENHVRRNSLPCVMFRKSFRHTKQTLKPHQA